MKDVMGVNKTGKKTLDRLAADPRIKEVWDEGRDGYWASLMPGYNAEGCSAIHGWTVTALMQARERIEVGDPY